MAFSGQLFVADADGQFGSSAPVAVRAVFVARPGVASTHSFVVTAREGGKVLAELVPAHEPLCCDERSRSVIWDRRPCACLRFGSSIEFALFERTLRGLRRALGLHFLAGSLGIEMERARDLHSTTATPIKSVTASAKRRCGKRRGSEEDTDEEEGGGEEGGSDDDDSSVSGSTSSGRRGGGTKRASAPRQQTVALSLTQRWAAAAAHHAGQLKELGVGAPDAGGTDPTTASPHALRLLPAALDSAAAHSARVQACAALNAPLLALRPGACAYACSLCHFRRTRLAQCPAGEARHAVCEGCMRRHLRVEFDELVSGHVAWACPGCREQRLRPPRGGKTKHLPQHSVFAGVVRPAIERAFLGALALPPPAPLEPELETVLVAAAGAGRGGGGRSEGGALEALVPVAAGAAAHARKVSAGGLPVRRRCIICRHQERCDGARQRLLAPHPYVPTDGQAEAVLACEQCLGELGTRRRDAQQGGYLLFEGESTEELCALCGAGGFAQQHLSLSCCGACPRAFCQGCLAKLLTPIQLARVPRELDWNCPICIDPTAKPAALQLAHCPPPTSMPSPAAGAAAAAVSPATAEAQRAQRANAKRRRLEQAALDAGLPPVHRTRDAVDYFAEYVRMVGRREEAVKADEEVEETEDSCYCCKDGGELVECDYNRHRPGGSVPLCTKVYHSECLGFEVPDFTEWLCPRHFCMACGSNRPLYTCRFCPMSFCQDHVPAESPAEGPAAADMPGIAEICCPRCAKMKTQAEGRGLFDPNAVPFVFDK